MNIDHFIENLASQEERLREARSEIAGDIEWYPYHILGNVFHLAEMLSAENRDLDVLAQACRSQTSGPPMEIYRSRWSRSPAGRSTSSIRRQRT